MQFDDRLATVLRQKAGASAGARTQYRQLLDLLGRPQPGRDPSLLAAARLRLDSLADVISVRERAEIIREQGRRLSDPALVAHFAEAEPDIASATLSTARLTETQWLALIPELPVRARGFLRLRRDLPEKIDELLERLGVHDRALPLPPEPEPLVEQGTPDEFVPETPPEPMMAGDNRDDDDEDIVDGEYTEVDDDISVEPEPNNGAMSPGEVAAAAGAVAAGVSGAKPAPEAEEKPQSEITALRKRIEAFQRAREEGEPRAPREQPPADDGAAPTLPFTDESIRQEELTGFGFSTDTGGTIDWADSFAASRVMYLSLP